MFRRCLAATVLVTVLSWVALAQDATTVISNTSKAMGADNLKTVEYILLEADSYNPPAQPNAPVVTPYSPYNTNLADNIERLKLDIQTIIPVHYAADGRKITKSELMRVVGKGN